MSARANAVPLHEIDAAAARIAPLAVRTPLLRHDALDRLTGGRLFVKAEPLQRTGSFKFRGAMNRIAQLSADELSRGVVAFSSGNHAQAVAHAAQLRRTPAVIVMPKDAPAMKIANTRGFGAEIILYDREREDREAIGRALAADRGLVLVPPFDDPHVMAGQGTIGLELVGDAVQGGFEFEIVLVCCSGGGLTAGIASALHAKSPSTRVYTVEPEGYDDTARSLASGERTANAKGCSSICDALLLERPGALTFPINRALVAGGLVVSDDEAMEAMRFAFEHLKLVLEPGGAVALAAALSGRLDLSGRTVAVIASGGNVDPAMFARALGAGKGKAHSGTA